MRSELRDKVAELLMEAIKHRQRSVMIFWLRAYCRVAGGSDPPAVPFSRLAEYVGRHEREVRWCGRLNEVWGRKLVAESGLFRPGNAEVAIVPEYLDELSVVCEKATAYWGLLKELHRRRYTEALPGILQQAALLWRHHLFFEFHEILEEVWMDWRGPERRFLQGLIQLGVAFYHIQRNNYRGAISMFRNGRAKVVPHVPRYRGVELKRFLEGIERCRKSLEHLGPAACHDFDWSLLPKLQVGRAK